MCGPDSISCGRTAPRSFPSSVVITGATGFVGRAVAGELLAAGIQVRAWSRDPCRAAALLPPGCECVAWDPLARVDPAALGGMDGVVHLAGENVGAGRWTPRRRDAILCSRIEGTRVLVRALAEVAEDRRPKVLIAASAIGFYGDRGDEVLDGGSAPGSGFLADVAQAWEAESGAAVALGVRTVVLRIGVVLGREGGALRRMLPAFRLGLGGPVGSGRQWMSWIHRDDLAALVRFVLEYESISGAVAAVAPGAVRQKEFARVLAGVLRRPGLLPLPAFVARLALGEMADLLLTSQRVRPALAEHHGFSFRYPDVQAALGEICGAS